MQTVVESRISKLVKHNFLYYSLPDEEDVHPIETDEDIEEAARLWNMSPEAVRCIRNAFNDFAEDLVDLLNRDLQDIWAAANR